MKINPKASEITLFVLDARRAEELRRILAKQPDIPANIVVAPGKLQGRETGPIAIDEATHFWDAVCAEPMVFLKGLSREDFRRECLGEFLPGGEPIADRLREVPVAQREFVEKSTKEGQELRRDRRKAERRIALAGAVVNTASEVASIFVRKGRR